jgi:hypothetical protein
MSKLLKDKKATYEELKSLSDSIGKYYVKYQGNKTLFSTHFFDEYGYEIGNFSHDLKVGALFPRTRQWNLSFKNELEFD